MKILNLEQGSDEWFRARLGVATASNFSKIITSTGSASSTLNDYALTLAAETLLETPDEAYKNADMERGNDLEPVARQYYEEYNFCEVKEVGFIVSDCGNYGYSSDGLVGSDGLIEIKCPKAKNHVQYMADKKCPTQYLAQIQGGLMVSGRKWCDFVSFHPDFIGYKKLFVVRVFRDEEFIVKLKRMISKLVLKKNEILNKINAPCI